MERAFPTTSLYCCILTLSNRNLLRYAHLSATQADIVSVGKELDVKIQLFFLLFNNCFSIFGPSRGVICFFRPDAGAADEMLSLDSRAQLLSSSANR